MSSLALAIGACAFASPVVAQDLFQKENKFLAPHGVTMQTENGNETSLTVQVAVESADDSWYKTIKTDGPNLCLDVPGGDAYNGNMLWLWDCNGLDAQIWVFDSNNKIRYGVDETFCIDAREMTDGIQLMLWECNDLPQQSWAWDGDAKKIFIKDTTTCLDLYSQDDGEPGWVGQELHVWECNGLPNQEWNLWGAPAPSGGGGGPPSPPSPPSPSGPPSPPSPPSPSGWDHLLPRCINGDQHGWPKFDDQASLQASPWGQYFQLVYGEVPDRGYPICTYSQTMLYRPHLDTAGVSPPNSFMSKCSSDNGSPKSPTMNGGQWYGGMTSAGSEADWSNWIWNPDLSMPLASGQGLPSDTWVEVHHKAYGMDGSATWHYYAPGTAIWLWIGSTNTYNDHIDAVHDILPGVACDDEAKWHQHSNCIGEFEQLYKEIRNRGYDTIQLLYHSDMACGNMAIEIVDPAGSGANPCGQGSSGTTRFKTGWGAVSDCNCDNSVSDKTLNCDGFGIRNR